MFAEENTVKSKSKKLAVKIIDLYKYLTENKKEYVLSKQLLRSGTSIGANLAEGECACSDRDFLNKLYIALKECSETMYWLELLYETKYIDNQQYESSKEDCLEIKRMLSSSTKTLKKKQLD